MESLTESVWNPALARMPAPARPVPVPDPEPVQQPAGLDLREEPEKPAALDEPGAARRQEPRASRRGSLTCSESEFRRLCLMARTVMRERPELRDAALLHAFGQACDRAGLPWSGVLLGQVLAVIRSGDRHSRAGQARRAQPPQTGTWRDRCPHEPTCPTPTRCELLQETGR